MFLSGAVDLACMLIFPFLGYMVFLQCVMAHVHDHDVILRFSGRIMEWVSGVCLCFFTLISLVFAYVFCKYDLLCL